MGVDQSVLLLKKGNDIEASDVLKQREKFNKVDKGKNNDKSYNDFVESDAYVITNAKSEFKPKPTVFPTLGYPDPAFRNLNYESSLMRFDDQLLSSRMSSFGGFSGSSANAASSQQSFKSGVFSNTRQPISNFKQNIDYMPSSYNAPQPNLQKTLEKPVEVRTVFPETWIFDSFEMPIK